MPRRRGRRGAAGAHLDGIHRTVSCVSRHLEANGVPTVVIANARDIVEHWASPLYFTDFPLGSPIGEPYDADMQRRVVAGALACWNPRRARARR